MAGTLYLCATPIGNLEDMTYRAVRILKEVDLIAAEDTRNSIKLLNHFEIKTKMTSYHEYNKVDKAVYLVNKLREGLDIAVITDAGTPGISDPGEELVRQCYEAGINVTSLPGACACITALTMSGQPTRRFAFEAFLPYDKKERAQILENLRNETRTIIIYEAPHHLKKTLKECREYLGNRNMTVCKELTKRYEQKRKATLDEMIAYYEENEPRGEYVLIFEGKSLQELKEEKQQEWNQLTVQEHMDHYLEKGMDKKSAMKQVAKDRGVSKRDIFHAIGKASKQMQARKLFDYNIVLIGFMGAGKTSISEYLKTLFAMDVIEMDQIIAEREGMSIPDIFEVHGEQYFRDLETNLLIEMQSRKNVVISCGGGTPLRECNVVEMKKNGRVVLLTASPETIFDRVKDSHDRPVIENNKNVPFIADLMEKRRAKYEAAADIIINTDGKSLIEVCEELVQQLLAMDENK